MRSARQSPSGIVAPSRGSAARCLFALLGLLVLALPVLGDTDEPANIISNGDFEEWEWVPIPPGLAKELKPWRRKGRDINIDVRGPAYRRWTSHGVTGHMVEGAEAYKGRSVLVNNDTTTDDPWTCVIGLHTGFGGILRPNVDYTYEIALKGSGTFVFRAWVQGVEPTTGRQKWLGRPDLIAVPVTDRWQVHRGTFRIPDYRDPDYQPSEKNNGAIIVGPNSRIYFDEFRVSEKE